MAPRGHRRRKNRPRKRPGKGPERRIVEVRVTEAGTFDVLECGHLRPAVAGAPPRESRRCADCLRAKGE